MLNKFSNCDVDKIIIIVKLAGLDTAGIKSKHNSALVIKFEELSKRKSQGTLSPSKSSANTAGWNMSGRVWGSFV